MCLSYNQHYKDNQTEQHSGDSCDICVNAKIHLDRARKARVEELINNTENTAKKVYAADMPEIITKQHFFVSRLVTFNETFACLNDDNEPDHVILWHEAISGRPASDVACAFL